MAFTWPLPELKTRPWFCPVSWSLSGVQEKELPMATSRVLLDHIQWSWFTPLGFWRAFSLQPWNHSQWENKGLFEHKLLLSFILFTIAHTKQPKLVPYFIQTLNNTLLSKSNSLLDQNFGFILISYYTVLFITELFQSCPILQTLTLACPCIHFKCYLSSVIFFSYKLDFKLMSFIEQVWQNKQNFV